MIQAIPLLLALQTAPCLPLDDERIRVRHLAPAAPALSALPGDTVVGLAPMPGVLRILRIAELQRLAKAHGLPWQPEREICVAWPLRPLAASQVQGALSRSLPPGVGSVELLDHTRIPVPPGEIVFPGNGLSRPSGNAAREGVIWRGHIVYAKNRQFRIWARVRLRPAGSRVVATEAIRGGEIVGLEQLRLEAALADATFGLAASSLDEVAGKRLKRAVPAGGVILKSWLEEPPAVTKGQLVKVEVHEGTVRFRFEAPAERTASIGETVTLRNPDSGRLFRARVVAPGEVFIGSSAPAAVAAQAPQSHREHPAAGTLAGAAAAAASRKASEEHPQ